MVDVRTIRRTDLTECHPEFAGPAIALQQYLIRAYEAGETHSLFKCFEALRLPARQNYVFREGRSKARAWQSAHNFGLAADFVPTTINRREVGWTWAKEADWTFLHEAAQRHGLTSPISWDLAHIQSPKWQQIKAAVVA